MRGGVPRRGIGKQCEFERSDESVGSDDDLLMLTIVFLRRRFADSCKILFIAVTICCRWWCLVSCQDSLIGLMVY